MPQRYTRSEKAIALGLMFLALLFLISLKADVSQQSKATTYIVAIVIFATLLEGYIYLTGATKKLNSRLSKVFLYIHGVSENGSTRMDYDGKFIKRFSGEFDGPLINLSAGKHKITFNYGNYSETLNAEVSDLMRLTVNVSDSGMKISTEQNTKLTKTSEEWKKDLKTNKRTMIPLLIFVNVLITLAILRILLIADMI